MKNLTNNITAENQNLLNALDAKCKGLGIRAYKGRIFYKKIKKALIENSASISTIYKSTMYGDHTLDLTNELRFWLISINANFTIENNVVTFKK